MILIDSNVLIDIIEHDDRWFDWSMDRITSATKLGSVAVSAVVVAEVAPSFASLSDFIETIEELLIGVEPLSSEAAFAGGRVFRQYLRRRGASTPKSLVADFLIGGHSLALSATLLTRDPRFYRLYFPELTLITPESHP